MKKKLGAMLLIIALVLSLIVPAYAADGTVYNGIDVSTHNGTIDWTAVKNAGYDFAMIRDGYGGDPGYWDEQKDAQFEANYSGAVTNGLKVGVYHYCDATNVTMASQEADECLYILNGRHLDYPVAYDIEDSKQYGLSSDTLGEMVQAFCSKIQQAGYKTVVYSYKNFYNTHLTSPLVSQYDTWIAQYCDTAPDFSNYTMWQHSNDGSVPGISGRVDLDYSYVDYAGQGRITPPPSNLDPTTFQCDTSSYTFGSNSIYTYKITTADTFPPTASSSNNSAVTVSGARPTSGGFLFTLTNVGAGDAVITTTAGDGRSVSFTATGSAAAASLRCDTSAYTFSSNSTYYYKITTSSSTAPTATSSNNSAVTVSYAGQLSDGYLYRINNVGSGSAEITTTAANGASVSFTAVGAAQTLRCDTSAYAFGSNSTYCYKITTSASSAPTATSSNNSAVTVSYAGKVSGGYLYRINNAGKGSAVITTSSNGTSVSFTAVGTGSVLRCDTSSYKFGSNSTYYYKIWASASTAPQAVSSNSSVVKVSYSKKLSDGYLYCIRKAGRGSATITTKAGGASVSFQAYS
ncbi:MAG TPA: glycoside hydrolase family 25 protein [Caproicibacter sp.]|nr:glycoside hydrolase family 25 protein [Caproicibacter sp.]